jgi:hypothetical protein
MVLILLKTVHDVAASGGDGADAHENAETNCSDATSVCRAFQSVDHPLDKAVFQAGPETSGSNRLNSSMESLQFTNSSWVGSVILFLLC